MSDFPYVPLASSQSDDEDTGFAMPVSLDASPYPEVDDDGPPDPDTVLLIKQDRSGSGGELTAILQYLYQNNRMEHNEAYANAILQISMVEMMHLDMLGDAIQALGGKPSFDDGQYYWQAGSVNYADTLEGMLEANIKAEQGAIDSYQKHAAQTKNKQVAALMLRIVKDEQLHLAFFQQMLAQLQKK